MRMVRIEAVSEIYVSCDTVPEKKSFAKCKSIRLCYELSRKRKLAELEEMFNRDDSTPVGHEKKKAKLEFELNDKNKLKINITAYDTQEIKKNIERQKSKISQP